MPSKFRVSAEDAGQTVAALLKKWLPDTPWSKARRLVERGKVRVGGEVTTDSSRRLREGAEVVLDEHAPLPAPKLEGAIVFEDAHVVVLDKPSGMSSVPYEKRESGTAMDLIRDLWRASGKKATVTPLHVVHRIDKETSGLIAFAKTKLAERALQDLFRAHDVERTYLCVAHGKVTDRRIESRLVTDRGDGLRGSTRVPKQGKRAVTHVRKVEELRGATLCEVRLETGKTHQIRIHLAENGHPLVGERVYIRDFLRKENTPIESPRLLLHAATLGFKHPISKKEVRLSSELPEDFNRELKKLRG
jgi:23S rRNA pseudouridine1911/1915/1917 synthase